jgi:formyltetrahydrofolate deformylase
MQFKNTAILLIHCPDKEGIVAAVTDFLFRNHGNVVELEQHVDKDSKVFFMRVEWQLENFTIEKSKIDDYFGTLVGRKFEMDWTLHFSDKNPRMVIFVSKASHCLYDILSRYQSKEWAVEIPLIISNHQNLEYIAERFEIPFYHVPITKENKAEQEAKHLELLAEHNIDFIVLARYMQIISDDFITHFPNKIINIHHSFLPAFIGAKPYHQAFERGVKIIGATSHYITKELDAGPIITQDVAKITHKEGVKELITKGKDLEKLVLSTGIALHWQHKVLSYGNKTVIFN